MPPLHLNLLFLAMLPFLFSLLLVSLPFFAILDVYKRLPTLFYIHLALLPLSFILFFVFFFYLYVSSHLATTPHVPHSPPTFS